MKNKLLVWTTMVIYSIAQCEAAVRTVQTNERAITPIYLSLGRTTVLRFEDRPKKVILGNSNYFNVEYIENDLAIQPTAAVNTNLFVYGESNVYGFSLHVGSSTSADDIVRVYTTVPRANLGIPRSKDISVRKLSIRKQLGSHLQFRLTNMVYVPSQNLMWIEVTFLLSEKIKPGIRTKEIEVRKIEFGTETKPKFVCEKDTIEVFSENSCRIFFPRSFSKEHILKIKFRGTSATTAF